MHLILGGPGCGKTTRLMGLVEQELRSCSPSEIGFIAFTRKAAEEARNRAAEAFGFNKDDIPYFRTLHSLSFAMLGLLPEEVMATRDYRELGEALGLKFDGVDADIGLPVGMSKGSKLSYLEQLARVQGLDLDRVCLNVDYWEVRRYADALASFKQSRGLLDFTDMVSEFIQSDSMPRLKALFVDEGQDLTAIHWQAVRKVMSCADRVYVAGDDDQAIYKWAGADVEQFLSLKAEKREVLPVSHRLPRSVFGIAQNIASHISQRYEKDWRPRDDDGFVTRYKDLDDVDLSDGSWLVLVRNAYLLGPVIALLRRQGIPYIHNGESSTDNKTVRAIFAWEQLRKGQPVSVRSLKNLLTQVVTGMIPCPPERFEDERQYMAQDLGIVNPPDWMVAVDMSEADRDYYRAVRRRGESLTDTPRVRLSTIHASKGGEADHVLLVSDMSDMAHRDFVKARDDECRVFFVGATRAKKGLHILYPRTNKFFPLLVS